MARRGELFVPIPILHAAARRAAADGRRGLATGAAPALGAAATAVQGAGLDRLRSRARPMGLLATRQRVVPRRAPQAAHLFPSRARTTDRRWFRIEADRAPRATRPPICVTTLPRRCRSRTCQGGDWRVIGTLLPTSGVQGRVVSRWRARRGEARQRRRACYEVIVDALDPRTLRSRPAGPAAAYGLLRLSTTRSPSCANTCSRRSRSGGRTIALEVFRHLHALSLRFHLARQTGGLTRDVEPASAASRP